MTPFDFNTRYRKFEKNRFNMSTTPGDIALTIQSTSKEEEEVKHSNDDASTKEAPLKQRRNTRTDEFLKDKTKIAHLKMSHQLGSKHRLIENDQHHHENNESHWSRHTLGGVTEQRGGGAFGR